MERVIFRGASMKIRVLDKTSNELRIEIEEEGHTFGNALQKILLEDKAVEMASYDVPHPLFFNSIIYIRTKGKRNPEAALKNAAEKLKQQNRDFKETFEKSLKKMVK